MRSALSSTYLNLADLVAGGNGLGTGKRGQAIEPVNGTITGKSEGFVDIKLHDALIPVPASPFVDGVFIPKTSTAIISTTGLRITDLPATSGQTWDYFRFGPSGGFTVNTIDDVEYNQPPQWMLALHANKGITFDLSAIRDTLAIESARFKALLGHGGEKGTSSIDFFVYLDGKRVHQVEGFLAQQPGSLVDLPLTLSLMLQDTIPTWAPGWLLQQPPTTWVFFCVAVCWLLFITWMNLLLPFLLTCMGTGVAVGLAWLSGSRDAMFALGGIGLLLFTFVLLIRIVSLLLSGPDQVLAVAHTVIKEASRSRISLIFILLLLAILPMRG